MQRAQLKPVGNTITRLLFTLCTCAWSVMVVICMVGYSIPANAQCTIDVATPIPDDGTLTLGLQVSGLVNGNLASPTQGICGVEISFDHENIGELTITLESPSGTQVMLVGPAATTLPTNLSVWDIDFIECMDTPMPDAGFAPVWSNNQGWQIVTPYNGSYHPAAGCLENFNTGPANGIWRIIIQDHDPNALGNLLQFTLLFCDPAGLSCDTCGSNAGSLSPAAMVRCENDVISTSEVTVNYGAGDPPAAEYLYEFLLVQGDVILQYGPFFNMMPPPGNYSLCGISYHEADSLLTGLLLEAGDFSDLVQAIIDGEICADLSSACVSLTVEAQPDTVQVDTFLCFGEVFIYRGVPYISTGTFIQVVDAPGVCDSIFEIRIAPRPLSINIPTPDTLTCAIGDVMMTANVTNAPGPFSYTWTTDFGNITSSPNLATITANQAGPYIVSVTDGLCDGTAFTNVVADQAFPQVFVDGATLSCNITSVLLEPIYVPTDGTIQWTGPGGFNSNLPTVSVSLPGTYFLEVTNQQGCSTTRPVDILIDTATINPVISIAGANCQAPFKLLAFSSSLPVASQTWSGPNGFVSTTNPVQAVDAGLYTVQVTFANGCVRNASYFFDGDFTIPDLFVPPTDTLNCNEVITVTAISNTPGVTFAWSGPEGFTSPNATINVDQAGIYSVGVYAANGCGNFQSITIVEGNDLFEFEIFTDTITCLQDTVPIQVVSAAADQFNWLNYNGSEQGMATIHVTTPGIYEVEMTDINTGCVMSGSIFVPADLLIPSFHYVTDTITCNNPVATLEIIPFPGFPLSHIYWELPDFSIVPGPTLMSGQVGEHRLNGVGPNGCIGVWHINIPRDTIPPFLLVESDTISCQDTVHILSQSLDSVVAYAWSGPGIIADLGGAIDVNLPGIYALEATGVNGCIAEFFIQVDSNYILPAVDLVHDSLRCDQPATLTASSPDPSVQFIWYDAGGQVLTMDSFVQVTQPGQYIVRSRGTNKCVASDTVTLFAVDYPTVTLQSDSITCAIQQVTITATVDVIPVDQYWLDANNDTIHAAGMLDVTNGGPYIFSVTGPNGCMTSDTISVPVDTMAPDATITLTGEIRCKDRDIMFSGAMSTPVPLSYLWATTGGTILSDITQPEINARDTGLYYLTVTNLVNGCENTDSFHLLPNPEDITGVQLIVIRPVCSGEVNGTVEISAVIGGIGPYLYQLPPAPPQVAGVFAGLSEGQHLLVITDAAGCEFDTLVDISATPDYTVDAGEDIEIYLGDTISLIGSSDLVSAEVATMYWDSLSIPLCTPCDVLEVSPWETTTYTFTVESVTGCVRSDEVIVYVLERAKYFVPNIFSPNGDGINDEIRLFAGSGIARVLRWIIFDRWGNAVYGATDFDPADSSIYWNGLTTTGETANPAVFPYLLEVQLINGGRQIYHGDITLIR